MLRPIALKRISNIGFLVGCIAFASVATTAQQVVHALVGTVSSIDSAAKTITVTNDDGTETTLRELADPKANFEIDKALRADTTPVQSFNAKGSVAIVLFYGEGTQQTAVALRSIGAGPFTKTAGTVVKFNGHEHSFSMKDESGAEQTFALAPDAVAETRAGAVDGKKFQPEKGGHVRIMSSLVNGTPTALYVYQM